MRKILLISLFSVLISFSAQAQPSTGTWLLGGGFGLTTGSTSTSFSSTNIPSSSRTVNLGLAPRVGYFVNDRVVVGLEAGYSRTMNKSGENRERMASYSASLFARLYHMVSERAGLFAQSSVGYSIGTTKIRPEGADWSQGPVRINEFRASLFPGFTYFIHNKIGAELALGGIYYSAYKDENTEQNRSNRTSGLGFNLSLGGVNLGLNYFLTR